MIKVMICDDLVNIQTYFSSIIDNEPDMEVVCTSSSKDEAIRCAIEHQPDIILMDIQMDTKNAGIEATKEIIKFLPNTK